MQPGLYNAIHEVPDQEGPNLRGIAANLRKMPILDVHLAPGAILGIRTAGEVAVVHGIGSNAAAIKEHPSRQFQAQPLVGDLNQRRRILRIIAGNAATDGEDSRAF